MSTADLPRVPAELADRDVAIWRAPMEITTYRPHAPELLPQFLDRRVYQGSSGRVYPMPFTDRVESEPVVESIDAVHLENRWLRLVVLPSLGGRIHIAVDKTTGYDFFYRNQVIKPALVGLAGPWMAGGVEFNWPQHHRPATWLPTDVDLVEEPDGAVTVWCSDHDPFTRMKGMHGVRLHPDRAVVEVVARLYNRTDLTQTFLWWANVAAKSNDDYQSFFPDDVDLVADHARRAVVAFPRADRPYYAIDYAAHADETFTSGGRTWTKDRLDFYRNIPVPTSYMCLDSRGNFFGGYDHGQQAGFVHVADPHVAIGKKQWSWGNAPFGRAWDDNLCDDGSSYVELMAGVFTDNQPDFAWLAPGETKVFTQTWYPIQQIGATFAASTDVAVSTRRDGDTLVLGLLSTRELGQVGLSLTAGDARHEASVTLRPGTPVWHDTGLPSDTELTEVLVGDGVHLRWSPLTPGPKRDAASEPPAPTDIATVDELYRVGVHLEQNRHASRSPEPYWREALHRDPGHAGSATALATRLLRRAEYEAARDLLHTALERQRRWNANPRDTEAHYVMGLVQVALGDDVEAAHHFGRALWTRAWRAAAGWQLALIAARAGDLREADERLADVLRAEPDHLQARALQIWVAHRQHRDANALLESARLLDPLDWWLRDLAGHDLTCDQQTCLDVALEYRRIGDVDACHRLLEMAAGRPVPWGSPAAGELLHLLDPSDSPVARASADWTFPNRLVEHDVLRAALDRDPGDARAAALLATWLYAHLRHDEAIEWWTRAVTADPDDWMSHRNLGLALMNQRQDIAGAQEHYAKALSLAPDHARLRFEADQLAARAGRPLDERLAALRPDGTVVDRDDAVITTVNLLLSTGQLDEAEALLRGRHFQPWEGGEGEALRSWDRLHLLRVRRALRQGDAVEALRWAEQAFDLPRSLGEQRHPLANVSALQLALGDALSANDRPDEARRAWETAAASTGDFVLMAAEDFSEQTASSLWALRRLGRDAEADERTRHLADQVAAWRQQAAKVDFFATSLPSMLLFAEDLTTSRDRRATLIEAQLAHLVGDTDTARRKLDAVLAATPDDPIATDLDEELNHD